MPGECVGRVLVGKITAPFGVKGWVKIHSFTDPASNIFTYRQLLSQRGNDWQPIEFDASRPHGKGLVAHVPGCDDRNAAALLSQSKLAVSADELPPLQEDDYYWRDLEGLAVYVVTAGGRRLLGQIAHMFATGANDVMVVESTDESMDGRQRLIPWVPGQYVLEVDAAAGTVLVDWDPDF